MSRILSCLLHVRVMLGNKIGNVCFLVFGLLHVQAFASQFDSVKSGLVVTQSVSVETKAAMTRYGLEAFGNGDAKNALYALLYTPKAKGGKALPMVVYIPGNGELGDVARHFRQPAIFDCVTSAAFQEKYPCFLLALTPPESATTLLGGMPGRPTGMQNAIREFVLEIAGRQKKPKVDLDRLYLTGFSYGGCGSYALAQHFPGMFAAVVPIAALPPLPEYFLKEKPGNWWHVHNEGDYARHGVDTVEIESFAKLVNGAGGDFRMSTFPSEGHDAWTMAWREDEVWDWMFSKSLKGSARRLTRAAKKTAPVSVSLDSAVCTASVVGVDSGHGPERVVDGLDATWYESKCPFGKDDWWQVDLGDPVRGRFMFASGASDGTGKIRDAYVESSSDGRRWTKVATFSNKDGSCSFASRNAVRYLRVRSRSSKPQVICLRRLKVVRDGR